MEGDFAESIETKRKRKKRMVKTPGEAICVDGDHRRSSLCWKVQLFLRRRQKKSRQPMLVYRGDEERTYWRGEVPVRRPGGRERAVATVRRLSGAHLGIFGPEKGDDQLSKGKKIGKNGTQVRKKRKKW